MGYPVGYLKYPEGVERMAFEVGNKNKYLQLAVRSCYFKFNIARDNIIVSIGWIRLYGQTVTEIWGKIQLN